MAKSLNLATLVTLAIAASLLGHTTATTYNVGGNAGWTFLLNATAYANWASLYTFTVGDSLVFNFVTQYHTVARVTKESFDQCNKVNPISEDTIGPATIPLSSPGEYYFICTVGEHCQRGGQKLAINVTSFSSTPASPPSVEHTPSPIPETPSPSMTETPPSLAPAGPAPTVPAIPPSSTASPPALGTDGPAPSVSATPPVLAPSGPAPSDPSIPISPTSPVSPPEASPPSAPSAAARIGLASIFTVFISAGLCLLV